MELEKELEESAPMTKKELFKELVSAGWEITQYFFIPAAIGYGIARLIIPSAPELGYFGAFLGAGLGSNAQDEAHGLNYDGPLGL